MPAAVRPALPLPRARRAAIVPFAPGRAGQRLKVGGERPAALPFIGGDDLFGLADLPFQLGHDLLRLLRRFRPCNRAKGEPGGLVLFQRVTVFPDLGPMPRNLTVAVCSHVNLLEPDSSIGDSPGLGGTEMAVLAAWNDSSASVARMERSEIRATARRARASSTPACCRGCRARRSAPRSRTARRSR